MTDTVRVVVVGAGLIGSSIAFRLAQGGYDVTIVDRGGVGAATSSACDKSIILQSKRPGPHLTMALESRAYYEDLEEELGAELEFSRAGGMIVIDDEQHLTEMHDHVEQQRRAGVDVTLLNPDDAHQQQPALSTDIIGAAYSPTDAEVNPLLLNRAFLDAAERAGADTRLYTEVTEITHTDQHITGVQTVAGRIGADVVVNAAGPFAHKLSTSVGIQLPITPRRGVILIGESMPIVVHGVVLCAHYILAKHSTGAGKPSDSERGPGLSLGQTAYGNTLIGASREFVGFQRHVSHEVLHDVAQHAVRLAPTLGTTRIIRSMVGFRPSTPDGMPIISEVPGLSGYVIAAGHEGDGIALAPLTGLMVRDLLNGAGNTTHLLECVNLERFHESVQRRDQE
jgi:sarcosine oxidase subunit beta